MVGDPDPLVRYQLAFSLGALPGRNRRVGARRAGGPRRGRSLDANGDSQLRVGLRRRGLHAAGRRCRLPLLAARPSLLTALAARPAQPNRPDDLTAVLSELDGPLAGDQATAR